MAYNFVACCKVKRGGQGMGVGGWMDGGARRADKVRAGSQLEMTLSRVVGLHDCCLSVKKSSMIRASGRGAQDGKN